MNKYSEVIWEHSNNAYEFSNDMMKNDMGPFTRILHTGFIVEKIETGITFFSSLCFKDFIIYDFKPIRAWVNGIEINDCYFKIGIGSLKDNTKIELIQPIDGATPQKEFLERNGSNIHHFAYQVTDYILWRKYFKERYNAKIVFEAETEDERIGYRRCFYAICEGYAGILEIAEKPYRR
jgi:hypothetical protein